MARQSRCPYCFKLLNSEDKVGAVISINGSIGPDENFLPSAMSRRWRTDNTREVKICKECVIYAEAGVMPISMKKLGEYATEWLKHLENKYACQTSQSVNGG